VTQPDVLVLLLDPDLNGMLSLSNVDHPTFTGDAVNTRCFQVQIIFDGLKETGSLPRRKTYSFDVMSHWHPDNAIKVGPTSGKKAIYCLLSRCIHPARWTECMTDLPVTVAILFEHTVEKLQFS
jgi:hypothetical protein